MDASLRGVQKYLSEKAAAAVQALLPESAGGELSTVCPWADQVRWHYHWASPLHYANTPQVCNFKYSRMYPLRSLPRLPAHRCNKNHSLALNRWGFNCPPSMNVADQFMSSKRALFRVFGYQC